MKTVKLIAYLTYNEDYAGHENDKEETEWFNNFIKSEIFLLHSNEIGDTIGTVRFEEEKQLEEDIKWAIKTLREDKEEDTPYYVADILEKSLGE